MIHTAPGMNPGMKPWILYLSIIGQFLSETYLFKSPLLGQLRKTLLLDHATKPILGVTNRIENSDAGFRAWFSKMYTDFLLGLKTAIWEIVLGPKMSTQPLLSSGCAKRIQKVSLRPWLGSCAYLCHLCGKAVKSKCGVYSPSHSFKIRQIFSSHLCCNLV